MGWDGRYCNFAELKRNEEEGRDFRIRLRRGRSGIAVIAPHGGNIEPGTSEIADAVASIEHTFYSFDGIKCCANWNLHLPSIDFDEPCGFDAVRHSRAVLAIHGCKGGEARIYIGGLDESLVEKTLVSLATAGFDVGKRSDLAGRHQNNICNRNLNGKGLQIEVTKGMRRLMFEDLSQEGRKRTTEVFHRVVTALRDVLGEWVSG